MKVDLFDFHLPEELIAQTPLEDRSSSRLMVLDKETGDLKHEIFKHIKDYLKPGDCLVLNDTKVLPARLFGVKEDTGAKIEVLLLNNKKEINGKHLSSQQNELKKERKYLWRGLLTAVCVEELDHGGRILNFNMMGFFMKYLIN